MHLLSGKTLESRRAQRPQTIIQKGSGGFAMEFNGTDEYLQIALPAELASFNPANTNGDWTKNGAGTIDSNVTTEAGSTRCIRINSIAAFNGVIKDSILTIGKKYKFTLKYKSTVDVRIQNNTTLGRYFILPPSSEWNTISKIFTAVEDQRFAVVSAGVGTILIESISIKEDQGFDLNRDQEQILHSKNWDFERTLGTELASGTVTIGSKYVVTAGTVEGNAVGTEFLAVTNATTLDANNKVREIPNLVTNGTCEGTYVAGYAPNWYKAGTMTASETTGVTGKAQAFTSAFDIQQGNVRAILTSKYIVGKRYRLSFCAKIVTSGSGNSIKYGLNDGASTYIITSPTLTTNWQIITTDISNFYNSDVVYFGCNGTGDTSVYAIDNVHLYEIPEWTASGNHTGDVSIIDKSGTGATNTQSMLISASGAGHTSNCVTLPSANLESCVAGKKYTIQGEARLDPASLTYGSELFTAFTASTAHPYETCTISGNAITSAINTTGMGSVYVNSFATVAIGEIYKVTFNFTLNSGTAPVLSLTEDANTISGVVTGNYTPVNGANTIYVVVTSNQTNADLILWNSSASNWALTDFSVVKASAIPTITAQLGTKSITSSALSIVAGTFTKFVLNFEATSGEVNQDLKLWLSGVGSVFVDKLSLTQAYDIAIGFKGKSNGLTFIPINFGTELYLALGDTTGGIPNERLTFYFRDSSGTSVSQYTTGSTSSDYLDGQFRNFIARLDRTNSLWLYTNGVKETTYYGSEQTPNHVGKMILSTALNVSIYISTYYAGQISHLQIIRFENISQSSFNSAITGLQYPVGGGAETVLLLDWRDGTTINNTLKDYSPMNHTITGVNIDSTNRRRVN